MQREHMRMRVGAMPWPGLITIILLVLAVFVAGRATAAETWQELVTRAAHRIILDHDQLAIDASQGGHVELKHATIRAAQLRRVATGLKHWPANPTNPRLIEFTSWAEKHFWDENSDEGMRLWLDRACQLQDIEFSKATVSLKQRVSAHAVLDVWIHVADGYLPEPAPLYEGPDPFAPTPPGIGPLQ